MREKVEIDTVAKLENLTKREAETQYELDLQAHRFSQEEWGHIFELLNDKTPEKITVSFYPSHFTTELIDSFFNALSVLARMNGVWLSLVYEYGSNTQRVSSAAIDGFLRRLEEAFSHYDAPERFGLRIDYTLSSPQMFHLLSLLCKTTFAQALTIQLFRQQAILSEWHVLATLVENMPEHSSLDLWGYKNIGLAGIQSLADALASGHCKNHLNIKLWNTGLDADMASHLAQSLQSPHCPQVLHLDVSSNDMGLKGLRAFTEPLAQGKLHDGLLLKFSYHALRPHFSHLCQAMSQPESSRVSLAIDNLDNVALCQLAETMQYGRLQGLTVYGARINAAGISRLALALEHCPTGFVLDLSDVYHYGDAGIKALAEVIAAGKAPQNLSLILEYDNFSETAEVFLLQALQSKKIQRGLHIRLRYENVSCTKSQDSRDALDVQITKLLADIERRYQAVMARIVLLQGYRQNAFPLTMDIVDLICKQLYDPPLPATTVETPQPSSSESRFFLHNTRMMMPEDKRYALSQTGKRAGLARSGGPHEPECKKVRFA
ncbi:MAG: hypothetical protein JJT82_00955 [Legionellaceae bacterium]|nr:hypothetical protein [Legionellaceae bacterium]